MEEEVIHLKIVTHGLGFGGQEETGHSATEPRTTRHSAIEPRTTQIKDLNHQILGRTIAVQLKLETREERYILTTGIACRTGVLT